MKRVEYNYFKVNDGVITSASAQLDIEPNESESHHIIINSEKIAFKSQGYIEAGHQNWNETAKVALTVALDNLDDIKKLNITVKKLEGRLFLDTNNASIGVACILALWNYLEYEAEKDIMEKIHVFVKNNWDNDISIIPNFNNIFEK